jgi:hypothetical protein
MSIIIRKEEKNNMECANVTSLKTCITCRSYTGGCGYSNSIRKAFISKTFAECSACNRVCGECKHFDECIDLQTKLQTESAVK